MPAQAPAMPHAMAPIVSVSSPITALMRALTRDRHRQASGWRRPWEWIRVPQRLCQPPCDFDHCGLSAAGPGKRQRFGDAFADRAFLAGAPRRSPVRQQAVPCRASPASRLAPSRPSLRQRRRQRLRRSLPRCCGSGGSSPPPHRRARQRFCGRGDGDRDDPHRSAIGGAEAASFTGTPRCNGFDGALRGGPEQIVDAARMGVALPCQKLALPRPAGPSGHRARSGAGPAEGSARYRP
jgi:hypothetical protein